MLSEVEVRCCRRLNVGGPMLSEVEVRRCRRPKKVHLSASIKRGPTSYSVLQINKIFSKRGGGGGVRTPWTLPLDLPML